jgi:DNA-binding XRE family transcriptional regulator
MASKKPKTPKGALNTTLGRNVKARREELDMSQEWLAERAGCTRHNISNIELGKQGCGLALFVMLCRALRSTPNTMLRGA